MKIEYNTLFYEEIDGIGELCINTPPANKMTPEFLIEITEAIYEHVLNARVKGVIITGTGRNFSSGADIPLLLQFIRDTVGIDKGIYKVPGWYVKVKNAFDILYLSDLLVVATISGCCLGSGFELALSSKLRIAENGALIGLPEATFGLIPGMCGTIHMIEEMGAKKAFEYILSGELVRVSKKEDFPSIHIVVKKHEAYDTAKKIINLSYNTGVKNIDRLCDIYRNS